MAVFSVGYQHLEGSIHAQNKLQEFAIVRSWLTPLSAASITGSVPAVKGDWGNDADEASVATQIVGVYQGKNVPTLLSEELGDLGAVYMVLLLFQASGTKYDDTHLYLGSGSNVFDVVYICGGYANPQFAVVVEAKGTRKKPTPGSRQLQYTGAKNGSLVYQGSQEYLEEEIQVLKQQLTDPTWKAIGAALEKLYNANNNSLIYIGVQTSYSPTQISIPTIWSKYRR